MATIIVSGNTEVASSDFTVVAGTPSTVFLSTTDGSRPGVEVKAVVQIKSAAGQYFTVGELSRDLPALVIDGPGTFRVLRKASIANVSIDQQ